MQSIWPSRNAEATLATFDVHVAADARALDVAVAVI
jgi:hypothetical protein